LKIRGGISKRMVVQESLVKLSLTLNNFLGKLHLRTFTVFANTSLIFKTSYLGVSNFSFLSLCLFCTENAKFTIDSKTKPFSKRRSFSFGPRGKIGIPLGFSVWKGQSERKPNFDTPK
jgi:hypothetical protein